MEGGKRWLKLALRKGAIVFYEGKLSKVLTPLLKLLPVQVIEIGTSLQMYQLKLRQHTPHSTLLCIICIKLACSPSGTRSKRDDLLLRLPTTDCRMKYFWA